MNIVKYYVDSDSYPNLLLVNKDFYRIFKTMTGPIMLHRINIRTGLLDLSNREFLQELSALQTIQLIIDLLEEIPKKFNHYHTKYTIKSVICSRIKRSKVLNAIGLIGY